MGIGQLIVEKAIAPHFITVLPEIETYGL